MSAEENLSLEQNISNYASGLNKSDRDNFYKKRHSLYWKTFIVTLLYGLFAIFILSFAIFTKWGNKLFFNDLYAFTITYIIGTIIIILWLTNLVYNYKLPTYDNEDINMMYNEKLCPDYWKYNKVNYIKYQNSIDENEKAQYDNYIKLYTKDDNPDIFNNYCGLDNNPNNILTPDNLAKNSYDEKYHGISTNDYTKTDNANFDNLYEYSAADGTTTYENTNLYVKLAQTPVGTSPDAKNTYKEDLGLNKEQYDEFLSNVAEMNGYNYDVTTGNVNTNIHIYDDRYKYITAAESEESVEKKIDVGNIEDNHYYTLMGAQPSLSSDYQDAGIENNKIVPLNCSKVFPHYMTMKDNKYKEEKNLDIDNTFRCAYSKACKIPWTSAGCE